MSRYLVEQIASKSNIAVRLHCEVEAAQDQAHLETVDIADHREPTVTRHECGGLFVFSGADADTGWLPEQVARDKNGYVLTGDDVLKAGRWSHTRDPFLLEASLPGVFACGDVRLSPIKRVVAAVGDCVPASVSDAGGVDWAALICWRPDWEVAVVRRCQRWPFAVAARRPAPPYRAIAEHTGALGQFGRSQEGDGDHRITGAAVDGRNCQRAVGRRERRPVSQPLTTSRQANG